MFQENSEIVSTKLEKGALMVFHGYLKEIQKVFQRRLHKMEGMFQGNFKEGCFKVF